LRQSILVASLAILLVVVFMAVWGRALPGAPEWPLITVRVEPGPTPAPTRLPPPTPAPTPTPTPPTLTPTPAPTPAGLFLRVDQPANLEVIHGPPEVEIQGATLPWSVVPERKRTGMLAAILETLSPDGQFLFYIYVQALPFWRRSPFARLLHESFETIEHGSVVWKNVPPAVVFACRGPRRAPNSTG